MVHFVGAGPGDPELLTLKEKRLLEEADVVIYAGSLVNPELLDYCREGAGIYNSASMTLDQVLEVMKEAEAMGQTTVRLHTGDPSVYGAHREQMDALERMGIPYDVTPGVSSFLAAAASLKKEYTLPGVSQTVILTRRGGRTEVPERESLKKLAEHQASMVIFLSVGQMEEVAGELAPFYGWDCPAAVVYRASWEDETIVRGTLREIGEKVRQAGITKTALIAVGGFLGNDYELSKLYDGTFTHGFRRGTDRTDGGGM